RVPLSDADDAAPPKTIWVNKAGAADPWLEHTRAKCIAVLKAGALNDRDRIKRAFPECIGIDKARTIDEVPRAAVAECVGINKTRAIDELAHITRAECIGVDKARAENVLGLKPAIEADTVKKGAIDAARHG